jgi:hypothetical protein
VSPVKVTEWYLDTIPLPGTSVYVPVTVTALSARCTVDRLGANCATDSLTVVSVRQVTAIELVASPLMFSIILSGSAEGLYLEMLSRAVILMYEIPMMIIIFKNFIMMFF